MTVKSRLLTGVSLILAMVIALGGVGIYHTQGGARTLLVLLMVATILIVVLVAYLSMRAVTVPLQRALNVARQVAAGDLTVSTEGASADNEFGRLLLALKTMDENLTRMVSDIRSGAETIRVSAEEVAAGNGNLSQRIEEQASTLEETASSMEQLTTAVRDNTESARKANTLAKNANEVAAHGGEVVGQVVSTMNGIQESSRKIADIISVIDGIAFQTNILALNAAVEAARAGEQGRGFAVVASEVRGLAQRSAEAAKEIKTLIGDSVEKVDIGTRLVESAGKTMGDIVESVGRVTSIIDQITTASSEQSSGIGQVNQAITQMEQVVQQNAAVVEQASAAADSMRAQARRLYEVVSVFKLDDNEAAHLNRRRDPARDLANVSKPDTAQRAPSAKPQTAPSEASGPVLPGVAAPAAARLGARPVKGPPDDGEWKEF